MRINYSPISKAEATAIIKRLTGIKPMWLVRTWTATSGAWDILCCDVPGSPDGRLAVAVYQDGVMVKRFNVL
jgi:hypothetical protein